MATFTKKMDKRNLSMERKRKLSNFVRYLVLIAVGLVMVYPLLWMIGATFKNNVEIFSGIGLIPKNPTLDGYRNAMKSYGGDINIWKAWQCQPLPVVISHRVKHRSRRRRHRHRLPQSLRRTYRQKRSLHRRNPRRNLPQKVTVPMKIVR